MENDTMETNVWKNVTYEIEAGAAWITINRPDKLNALNRQTVEEIVAAVRRARKDEEVAVIVLTGAGDKAFVAGADIREMSRMTAAEAQNFSRFLQHSLDVIERAPKPVLAAVNGLALGGGCELAMACHVRFAADNARFGQPEVNLGLIPGAGGTQRLQRLVGRGRALDLILSGEMIDADTAERIGLANRVVPRAELKDSVSAYVKLLRAKSPIALTRAIEAIVSGGEVSQAEAMRLEAGLFGLCFATEDMREGTGAFLEKRKPAFHGN
jgi:enoyl-CoA hydratase